MIEILTIVITLFETNTVKGPDQMLLMYNIKGKAQSPYFEGETITEGVMTYSHGIPEEETTVENGTRNFNLIIKGKDFEGNQCKVYINNIENIPQKYSFPHIITDCKALNALNNKLLLASYNDSTLHIYKAMTQVPDSARKPAAKQGKMEEFKYTVNMDGRIVNKHAQVYVPYGYNKDDKEKKYNVLYLMHGYSDNSTSFLTPPHNWLRLLDILDHLIEDKKMDPILVVTPTVYEHDLNMTESQLNSSIENTNQFHLELRKYLIPTVEKEYNTYYTGTEKGDIENTRAHRAFGGFSMGSMCTWLELAYDLEACSRFIPLSGDIWIMNNEGEREPLDVAAKWINDQIALSPYAHDFKVFAYTGTKDLAYESETTLVQELYKYDLFTPKNMEFGVKEGGEHYYGHVNEYLYHALPLLWEKQPEEESEEEPKEETKEEPNEDSKEESKDESKEETKEDSKEFYIE